MTQYTDEELLSLDFDQVGREPKAPAKQEEDHLMDDVADIMALLNEDHRSDPPRAAAAPGEQSPKARHKAPAEKKRLTQDEKLVKALSILAWVQGAAVAGMAVGIFLWMR